MNLLNQVKAIPGGAVHLASWVGEGGRVVDQDEAQRRADICIECTENAAGLPITREMALATKKLIEFKNGLKLRVNGEKSLHHCSVCTCVLTLMIWEPLARVKASMTAEEVEKSPSFCWKLDQA